MDLHAIVETSYTKNIFLSPFSSGDFPFNGELIKPFLSLERFLGVLETTTTPLSVNIKPHFLFLCRPIPAVKHAVGAAAAAAVLV